jgi:hypothetical protein
MIASARRLNPTPSETQAWERSAAANPPSHGRARAIARRDKIRRGDGNAANASHSDSIAYPQREIRGVV